MHVWDKSYACIFLIFLAAVRATPLAIPTLGEEEDVYTNASPPSNPTSSSSSSSSTQILHLPLPRSLQPIPAGAHVTVAHGWIITRRTITTVILPVQATAAILEYFFHRALVELALRAFQNRPPPGSTLRLSIGSVSLALQAVNPNDYLTWETCEIILAQLLNDVRMGFTAQFRSEWFHPASGILLYISLGVFLQ